MLFLDCLGYYDWSVLNCNTCYSRWPVRTRIINTHSSLSESAFPYINFPLDSYSYRHTVLSVILLYIALVFAAHDHKNVITDFCCSPTYSVNGVAMLNVSQYYYYSQDNGTQLGENYLRFILCISRHIVQGCQHHFWGNLKSGLLVDFPSTSVLLARFIVPS